MSAPPLLSTQRNTFEYCDCREGAFNSSFQQLRVRIEFSPVTRASGQ